MTIRFIDAHGYAGAFSLGATQAGMEIVAKLEDPKGFGIPAMLGNRHIFAGEWVYQQDKPVDWEPFDAEVIIGNPPCSGFSGLNTVKGTARSRGVDSSINQCMHDLFSYAAKVKPAVVIMESVQAAFTKGESLMTHLVSKLSNDTGRRYRITHVLQNNLSTGGCSDRPRYFLVAHAVPFGVEPFPLTAIPTLEDAIGDLARQPLQWEPQQLLYSGGSWWSAPMRTPSAMVDGHMMIDNAHTKRIMALVTGDRAVEWRPGEIELNVMERYYTEHAKLPEEWDYPSDPRDGSPRASRSEVIIKREFKPAGFSSVLGWHPDRPARVLTGAGPNQAFNVMASRMLTHRECARIMGFPDWWRIEPWKDVPGAGSYWGKQTSVHPARWICYWVNQSLQGNPGSVTGEPHGEGYLVNITHDWKRLRRQPAAALS